MGSEVDYNPEKLETRPENGETGVTHEYAEIWEGAMDNTDGSVPPFDDSELWLEGEEQNASETKDEDDEDDDEKEKSSQNTSEQLASERAEPIVPEQNSADLSGRPAAESEKMAVSVNAEIDGAGKMVDYGFDTACRIYGLGSVLQAVQDVDESDRDAENPLGALYERIATTPTARAYLYNEIQKDSEEPRDNDTLTYNDAMPIGLSPQGEFYQQNTAERRPDRYPEGSTEAIRAMKRLLERLEYDDTFANLRESAAESGMDVIDYLVKEYDNPTISNLLERASEELTAEKVEEVITEIEATEEERAEEEESAEMAEDVEGLENADGLEGSESPEGWAA